MQSNAPFLWILQMKMIKNVKDGDKWCLHPVLARYDGLQL